MSPSTWNFAGDEARTAFTALEFHANTASGGIPGAGDALTAGADDDASSAATAAAAAPRTIAALLRKCVLLISFLLVLVPTARSVEADAEVRLRRR
jgi:hypothetical protein